MSTQRPPESHDAIACWSVCGIPTHSKAYATPVPVSSRIRAIGSTALASTTSVAPKSRAHSSLRATRSTATIRPAPASREPWMTLMPMAPHPYTATLLPAATSAA